MRSGWIVEQIALRIQGELLPSAVVTTPEGEIVIRRSSNGHFYADATVNGSPVRMLIDTGASSVVLNAAAARRIGLNVE
jgi:aspartyl protease family protein